MEIGTKIKKIRELKNLTQDYMAQQLNVSQSTYSRIEKDDDGDLTLAQLKQISEILEVKVEDLINFNDKFIFNNFTSNQANQGYIVNNISPVEKELYEKHIGTLEKEVEHLKQLIDKLSSKF